MQNTYLDLLARYGVSSAHPGGFAATKRIVDDIDININTRLLDLGCGTGQTLVYIAEAHPCKATGVDINRQMLLKAAQRVKAEGLKVDLVHGDVMSLPFSSNTFDIALSESVTIFTSINRALKEYSRVLKENGTLVAVEMTAEYPLRPGELGEIKSVYGIERVPSFEEWKALLSQAGFSEIESYRIRMNSDLRFLSVKMMHDFYPHIYIMRRYVGKLGYRVYKCKKK